MGRSWTGPGACPRSRARDQDLQDVHPRLPGARLRRQGHALHRPDPAAARAGRNRLRTAAVEDRRDKPWTAANAAELDSQTLETFKLANSSTPGARFVFDLATKAILAAEPRDVSLLHAMFYFHSGNGVLNLASTSGGAQDSRFVGGSQLVSILMAQRLGDRVFLQSPVRRISYDGRGATVETDSGSWHGRRVIVAMAPMLAGRIDYEPALPPLRDGLTQRVPQGSVIKYQAVYPTPFWRAQGLNGYANSDRPPVSVTFDNSPAGRAARVRRRCRRQTSLAAVGGRETPRRARLVPEAVRCARRAPDDAGRAQLVGRSVDARLLRRIHAARRLERLRPGVA